MHKPERISVALLTAAASAALSLGAITAHAASLKDLGKSLAYPLKKGAHNAGKTVREGAGHASKGINHAGQAAQYPVRKTGENASKTTHQTVKDAKKK